MAGVPQVVRGPALEEQHSTCASAAEVDIEGLEFCFPDGAQGLRGVDLHVPRGAHLALLGRNGAGKSTLLLHINGLIVGRGSVRIGGVPVIGRNLTQIRSQVGLVFQSPDDQLFMPTVYDEVAYAALNAGYGAAETDRRVACALETVGCTGLAGRHPMRLSVGQKKRVALASVLVTDNRVLLLDEPSTGLDPAGRRDLIALLCSLSSTMLIATHDLQLAEEVCGLAAVMNDGRVVRTGAVEDVLRDEAFLRAQGL